MGIGLSGLTSGMDTDAIVEAMVMEKTERKNSYVKARTKLEWKQDAWKTLNSKIYSFYTKSLSNMRLASTYNKKTVSVSNPSIATVIAKNGSVDGTQSLAVEQLAKAGYLTGGKIATMDGGKVSGSTKLSELGITDGTSINITIAGRETVIDLSSETTVNELVSKLKSAGVNASFDATNQRFFVSAKDSGKDNDFSFTTADADGISALKKLGLYTGASAADVTQYSKWAAYLQSDIDYMIQNAYESQKTDADKEKALLETEIEDLTKTNEGLVEKNKTLAEEKQMLEYKKEYAQKYLDGTSADYYDEVKADLDAYEELVKNGTELTEEQQAEYDVLKDKMAAIKEVDKAIGNEAATTTEQREEYISDLTEEIEAKTTAIADNEATITANVASIEEKQAIVDGTSATETLENIVNTKNAELMSDLTEQYNNKWKAAKNYMVQYNYNNGDEAYKLANQAAYEASVAAIGDIKAAANTDGTGAVRIDGQDAIIYLNGAKFEGTSNTFSVNGLTITAQELTGKDANGDLNTVSITTSTDAQGIYDMVKDFLKGYNELINEMDKLYNADSSRGYEPLTSEEKEEMTDNDIELWETKIKDSLLRRDSSLSNIINVMKSSMSRGVNIDGKQYYLSGFGIATAGYFNAAENERGAYHIDGDEDDSLTSGKTDKLMAAILEDPDQVMEVLSGIATNLYDNMTTAMRSTTLSSTYTVYNDKQMKEEYNSYTEKIADAEEDIIWWQDYYRSKFTYMESMLASLNQQSSSLSGLLG